MARQVSTGTTDERAVRAAAAPETPRLPAEWETQERCFLAWPSHEEGVEARSLLLSWTFVEFIRNVAEYVPIDILVSKESIAEEVTALLSLVCSNTCTYQVHVANYQHCWIRDTGPTAVIGADGVPRWVQWRFNRWGSQQEAEFDVEVAASFAQISGLPLLRAELSKELGVLAMEGGAFESDGEGTMIVTEDCLLNGTRARNKLTKEEYQELFFRHLGITKTIWLKGGSIFEATGGHADMCARFVAPGRVVLSEFSGPTGEPEEAQLRNLELLADAVDAKGRPIEVTMLPSPKYITFGQEHVAASYTNFFIGNGIVVVPMYHDRADARAIAILTSLFPGHEVRGLAARDLAIGGGSFHCITQPQFRADSISG